MTLMSQNAVLAKPLSLLLVSLCLPQLCYAQTTADLPLCQTTSGVDGVVFDDMFSVVSSPDSYDVLTSSDGDITPFDDLRAGLNTVVYAAGGDGTKTITLEFKNSDDGVVYACAVTSVQFDPAVYTLSGFGACNFTPDDLIRMAPGTSQDFAFPEDVVEVAAAPGGIIDVRPLPGAQGINVTAGTQGVATLVWLSRDAAGENVVSGVCPFEVSGPTQ